MSLKNFQGYRWKRFLDKDMLEAIELANYEDENLLVQYKISDKSYVCPDNPLKYLKAKKSYVYNLYVDVKVINKKLSNTEDLPLKTTKTIKLMEMPYLTDYGFIIDGNKRNYVSILKLANGWFLKESNENKNKDTGEKRKILYLRTKFGGKLEIGYTSRGEFEVRTHGGKRNDVKIPLLPFCIALTGLTSRELLEAIGQDLGSYSRMLSNHNIDDLSIDKCIKQVYQIYYGLSKTDKTTSTDQMLNPIRSRFYNRLNIGEDGIVRYKEFISFAERCKGLKLAEDITLTNGTVVKGGKIPNREQLLEMDADESLRKVLIETKDGEIKTIMKYPFSENMCDYMLFNVLNAYFCLLDGVGDLTELESLKSKVAMPFTDKLCESIIGRLDEITKKIVSVENKDLAINLDEVDWKAFNSEFLMAQLKTDKFMQLMDDTNSLTELNEGFKLRSDAPGNSVTVEMRDIKQDQYGRICPLDTPERKEVGLSLALASNGDIDNNGFITTKYYRVRDGKRTDEIVTANAFMDTGRYIARWDSNLDDEKVFARLDGVVKLVEPSKVDYIEVGNNQILGYSAGMIPFIEGEKSKRAVMGVKMLSQAVPVIGAERCRVTTGQSIRDAGIIRGKYFLDAIANNLSDKDLADRRGSLYSSNIKILRTTNESIWKEITYTTDNPDFNGLYTANVLYRTGGLKNTYKTFLQIQHTDGVYAPDDIVFHRNDVDVTPWKYDCAGNHKLTKENSNIDADLALGRNLVIIWKCYRGYTYEDAIIINEKIVRSQKLSSVKVTTIKEQLSETKEYEDSISGGLPLVGSYIHKGETLFKVKRKFLKKRTEDIKLEKTLNLYDKVVDDKIMVRNVDATINQDGYVIDASITSVAGGGKQVVITIGKLVDVGAGDKFTGRHGNKGVVAKILPEQDMPILEDGTIPDIIFNPLGVLARVNTSQLSEAILGAASLGLNEIEVVPSFENDNYDFTMRKVKEAGLKPMWLYDGVTGLRYPQKVYKGYMYVLKLNHMIEGKYHAIASAGSNVKKDTLQPKGGTKARGGQRISELQVQSILSNGCEATLQTLQAGQSCDNRERKKINDCFNNGKFKPEISGSSMNGLLMKNFLNVVGVDIENNPSGGYICTPVTDEFILANSEELEVQPNADPYRILHDPKVFPHENRKDIKYQMVDSRRIWGHLKLNTEVIMPLFLLSDEFLQHFYIKLIKGYNKRGEPKYQIKRLTSNFLTSIENRNYNKIEHCIQIDVEEMVYYKNMKEVPDDRKEHVLNGYWGINQYMKQYSKERLIAHGFPVDMLYYNEEEEKNLDKVYTTNLKVPSPEESLCREISVSTNYTALNYKYQEKRIKVRYIDIKPYIVSNVLVMPIAFRPEQKQRGSHHDIDVMYANLIRTLQGTYDVKAYNRMYTELCKFQRSVDASKKKGSKLISITSRLLDSSLDKKSTLIRGAIKGFRVEYSGRTTITGDPFLSLEECGVPYSMIVTFLEKPLIVSLQGAKLPFEVPVPTTGTVLRKTLTALSFGNLGEVVKLTSGCMVVEGFSEQGKYKIVEKFARDMFEYVKKFARDYRVLLNREPALHRFNERALIPVPVMDSTIHLHPMLCKSYNGDFDGDGMSAVLPVSAKAQREIAEKMCTAKNLVNPKDNKLIVTQAQDIIYGLYCLTRFEGNAKNFNKWDATPVTLYDSVQKLENDVTDRFIPETELCILRYKGRMYYSTAGRLILNSKFTQDLGFTEEKEKGNYYKLLADKQITGKYMEEINRYLYSVLQNDEFVKCLDMVKDLGFLWSDLSGLSLSIFDFEYKKSTVEGYSQDAEKQIQDIDNYTNMLLIPKKDKSKLVINRWASTIDKIESIVTTPITQDLESYRDFNSLISRGDNIQKIERYLEELYPIYTDNALKRFVICSNSILDIYEKLKQGIDSVTVDTEKLVLSDDNNPMRKFNKEFRERLDSAESVEQFKDYYISQLQKLCLILQDGFPVTSQLYALIDSGARGKFGNYAQIVGIAGQVSNVSGKMFETPLRGSYIGGLNSQEYFYESFFARKGVISSSIQTADSGAITKCIVTLLQDVKVVKEDCGGSAFTLKTQFESLTEDTIEKLSESYKNTAYNRNTIVEIEDCDVEVFKGQRLSHKVMSALACSEAQWVTIRGNRIELHKVLSNLQREWLMCKVFAMPSEKDIKKYNISERDLGVLRKIEEYLKGYNDHLLMDAKARQMLKGCEVYRNYFKVFRMPTPEEMAELPVLDQRALKDTLAYLTSKPSKMFIDEKVIDIIQQSSLNYMSFRSAFTCECEKGICQKCYGQYEVSRDFPDIGTNAGVISAQAIGEPSTQLTLDTTHGKASDAGMNNSMKTLEGHVNASLDNTKEVCVYTYNSVFYRGFESIGVKDYTTFKENCLIRNVNRYKTAVTTLESSLDLEDRYVLQNNSLTKSYRFSDLMLLDYNNGRFRLMESYYNIFNSKNIDVKPIHFELVANQQTKCWLVTETVKGIPESSIISYKKVIDNELLPDIQNDYRLYVVPMWMEYSNAVKYSGNALAYIGANTLKSHVVDCVVNKVVDDGKSVLSKQIIGADLTSSTCRNLQEYSPVVEKHTDTFNEDLKKLNSLEDIDIDITETIQTNVTNIGLNLTTDTEKYKEDIERAEKELNVGGLFLDDDEDDEEQTLGGMFQEEESEEVTETGEGEETVYSDDHYEELRINRIGE